MEIIYLKSHPGGGFEDFCRFYLASPRIKHLPKSIPKPAGPTDVDGMFMMTVSRCTLAFWVYMRIALKDTQLGKRRKGGRTERPGFYGQPAFWPNQPFMLAKAGASFRKPFVP